MHIGRNGWLWFGGCVGPHLAGWWMLTVVEMWLIFTLTGSGAAVGAIGALKFVPSLLVAPWVGVWADHWSRRRLVAIGYLATSALAAVAVVLIASGWLTVWAIVVLASARGVIANSVIAPAAGAFQVEVVGRRRIATGEGIFGLLWQGSALVGSVVGVLLIAQQSEYDTAGSIGAAVAFALAGALAGCALVCLAAIDPRTLHAAAPAARAERTLREALRAARSVPELRITLLVLAGLAVMVNHVHVLLPLLSRETWHGTAGTYLWLVAGLGCGQVTGALLVMGLPQRHVNVGVVLAAVTAWGTADVLAGTTLWFALQLPFLFLAGVADAALLVVAKTQVQIAAGDAMRGRILALYGAVGAGLLPVGYLVIGWLADLFGPRFGVVCQGAAALGIAAVGAVAMRRAGGRSARATLNPPTTEEKGAPSVHESHRR